MRARAFAISFPYINSVERVFTLTYSLAHARTQPKNGRKINIFSVRCILFVG